MCMVAGCVSVLVPHPRPHRCRPALFPAPPIIIDRGFVFGELSGEENSSEFDESHTKQTTVTTTGLGYPRQPDCVT
jgi:hypothetical protein